MMIDKIIQRNAIAYQMLGGAPINALYQACAVDKDVFLVNLDRMIKAGTIVKTETNRFRVPEERKNEKRTKLVNLRLTKWQFDRLTSLAEFNGTSIQKQIYTIVDTNLQDVR